MCAQPCLTLWNPMDCSLPSSSVYGIFSSKNTGVGCVYIGGKESSDVHGLSRRGERALERIFRTIAITQAWGNGGLGKSGKDRSRNRTGPLVTDFWLVDKNEDVKGERCKRVWEVLSLGNWENCDRTYECGKLEGGINLEIGVRKHMRFGTCQHLLESFKMFNEPGIQEVLRKTKVQIAVTSLRKENKIREHILVS